MINSSKEFEASTCYPKPQIRGPKLPYVEGQSMELTTHQSLSDRLACLHHAQIDGIKTLPTVSEAGPRLAVFGGDVSEEDPACWLDPQK